MRRIALLLGLLIIFLMISTFVTEHLETRAINKFECPQEGVNHLHDCEKLYNKGHCSELYVNYFIANCLKNEANNK